MMIYTSDYYSATVNVTVIWTFQSFVFTLLLIYIPYVPPCDFLLRGKSDCRCCNSEHDTVDEISSF